MVRYPLYAFDIISYVLVAPPGIGVLATIGIAAQMMRARREEDVLRGAFPEYVDYAIRVPRYLPRLGRATSSLPHHATPEMGPEERDEALAA